MHYSATSAAAPRSGDLLHVLGGEVRRRRNAMGLSMRELATRASMSERFVAQVETGEGNISVLRLRDLAHALGTSCVELLRAAEPAQRPEEPSGILALVGLRGAGKSTVGQLVAKRLRIPFVELDALVARDAGMSLATMFDMHGEAYYRRAVRDALQKFLDTTKAAVLATGGSIVSDDESYRLLQARATTIWLKAKPHDHWQRVVAQGDGRPMNGRPEAMQELRELLRARGPLYAQAAHTVDTSQADVSAAVDRIVALAKRR